MIIPNPPLPEFVTNQTIPTAAILTKPPIMSALEVPTSKKNVVEPPLDSGLNIEDSLAAIGVSTTPSNVPSSLELPITVTNPAIASKTSPLTLNTIYTPPISSINTIGHISQISPSLGYDIFETTAQSSKIILESKPSPNDTRIPQFSSNIPDQILHQRIDDNELSPIPENQNSIDNIIPASPDMDITPSTPQIDGDDGEHSNNSVEIPIQPSNFIDQIHQNNNSYIQENHNINDDTNHKDDER